MSTTTTDPFNFSAEPVAIGPFSIPGFPSPFVLREASEAAYTAYRNATMPSVKVLEDNTRVMQARQEGDSILLQKCLFQIATDGKEHPVSLDLVTKLPRKITQTLYTKIREISGLDEEDETIEVLTKRIERDTKKLNDLKADKETEVKND